MKRFVMAHDKMLVLLLLSSILGSTAVSLDKPKHEKRHHAKEVPEPQKLDMEVPKQVQLYMQEQGKKLRDEMSQWIKDRQDGLRDDVENWMASRPVKAEVKLPEDWREWRLAERKKYMQEHRAPLHAEEQHLNADRRSFVKEESTALERQANDIVKRGQAKLDKEVSSWLQSREKSASKGSKKEKLRTPEDVQQDLEIEAKHLTDLHDKFVKDVHAWMEPQAVMLARKTQQWTQMHSPAAP